MICIKIIFFRYCVNVVNDIPLKNFDENLNIINENYVESVKEIKKSISLVEDYFEGEDDEWDNDVEGLSIQAVELVLTVLDKPEMQSLTYCGLYPIINTIMSFLLITKVQVKEKIFFFFIFVCNFFFNLICFFRKENGF